MKRKIFIVLILALIVGSLLYAWTGSDPSSYITRLGTGETSAVLDGETVNVPSSVFVRIYNSTQAIDKTWLYLIEDANSDTMIQQSELDAKRLVVMREDLNLDIDNVQFGPRYILDSGRIKEGKSYFLVLPSMDLNGDYSTNVTTLAGCGPDGDATHSDTDIRQFYGGSLRP